MTSTRWTRLCPTTRWQLAMTLVWSSCSVFHVSKKVRLFVLVIKNRNTVNNRTSTQSGQTCRHVVSCCTHLFIPGMEALHEAALFRPHHKPNQDQLQEKAAVHFQPAMNTNCRPVAPPARRLSLGASRHILGELLHYSNPVTHFHIFVRWVHLNFGSGMICFRSPIPEIRWPLSSRYQCSLYLWQSLAFEHWRRWSRPFSMGLCLGRKRGCPNRWPWARCVWKIVLNPDFTPFYFAVKARWYSVFLPPSTRFWTRLFTGATPRF